MSGSPQEAFTRLTTALARMTAASATLRSASSDDRAAIDGAIALYDRSSGDAVAAFADLAESDVLEQIEEFLVATYGGRP